MGQILTLPKISYLLMQINMKYFKSFKDSPIDFLRFRDFFVNYALVLYSAKIEEPVLVLLDRVLKLYTNCILEEEKYAFLRKFAKRSLGRVEGRFKSESILEDGAREITIATIGFEKRPIPYRKIVCNPPST